MKTTRMPDSKCAQCGTVTSGATCTYAEFTPSSGDISVCLYCGYVSAYNDDLTLRELTKEEAAEAANDPIVKAMNQWRLNNTKG